VCSPQSRAGEPLIVNVSCITEEPLREKLARVCAEVTALAEGKEPLGNLYIELPDQSV